MSIDHKRTTEKGSIKAYGWSTIIVLAGLFLIPSQVGASDGWVFFAREFGSSSTKYYYDLESVRYFSADHVSVWIKMGSSPTSGGKTLQTEINCPGRLFRVVQNPKVAWTGWWDFFEDTQGLKRQYVVGGWLDIPPDSEMHNLKKILCNNPKKDFLRDRPL